MVTIIRPAVTVGVMAFALAGCGGGGSTTPATVTVTSAPATSAPAASSPSAPASSPAASSAPASETAAAGGRGDAGRTFDSLSQKATVPTDEGGKKIQLTIGPVQVVTGSLADLKSFKLPATVKGLVPIYVTGTFTHAGGPTVKAPYFMSAMFAENAAGDAAQGITLLGEFPKCEATHPSTFAEGDSVKQCRIYLLPKGDKPARVYGSWAGFRKADYVSWKVG